MSYKDFLLEKEWKSKCNEILSRDYYTCQDCGRLGFHSKNNYMVLPNLETLDIILNKWRFNGLKFSEYYKSKIETLDYFIVQFNKKERYENVYLNELLLYSNKRFNLGNMPYGLTAVSDYEIYESKARMHLSKIVSSSIDQTNNWLFYLEFDDRISDKVYFNIEYNLYGFIEKQEKQEKQIIDNVTINITYQNKFYSIQLSPRTSNIVPLNIHHNYYIEGHKPWEYNNNVLVTLCEKCHEKRHNNVSVPLYKENKELMCLLKTCPKCNGSGYIPEYYYFKSGICFECEGEGVVL